MRLKSLITNLVLAMVFFGGVSCQKQQAPDLAPDQEIGDVRRLESCSHVSFSKDLLEHYNTIKLFECTEWDKTFPHLYQSIRNIPSSSWNHLMGPIDDAFFDNKDRRDRAFRNIKILDQQNGLDDLSYVLTALNETNFFDALKDLFKCVKDPEAIGCELRKGRIPTKSELKNVIKLVDLKPESVKRASSFMQSLSKALKGNEEEIRSEIQKFNNLSSFINLRLKLVDAVAMKAIKGLSEEDRLFLSNVLLVENGSTGQPWLYSWIQDENFDQEKFKYLIEYTIKTNPEMLKDLRGLKRAYDEEFVCHYSPGGVENDTLTLDFNSHLGDYVSVIKEKSYKSFFNYTLQDIASLKLATPFCYDLERNKYGINFVTIMEKMSDLLSEPKYYDVFKFLMTHTTAKGEPGKTFAENLYLFDMMTEDSVEAVNNMNKIIVANTEKFYPAVFKVLKQLPPEAYTDLGEMSEEFFKHENDKKFEGLAKLWFFYSEVEKNFLFNFIDRHFDKNTNFPALFDFYVASMQDVPEVLPFFKDQWIGDDDKLEKSYQTLEDVFTQFSGKDTLLDFKKFFSRDQVLRVMEVISKGVQIKEDASKKLEEYYSDRYVLASRQYNYVFKVSYKGSTSSDYDPKPALNCIKEMAKSELSFYALVKELPPNCQKMSEENIAMKMFSWMEFVNEDFGKVANDSNGDFIDQLGLFSPLMLNTNMALGKIIDQTVAPLNVNSKKGGLRYLLNSSYEHLFVVGGGQLPLVEKTLAFTNDLLNVEKEKSEVYRQGLLKDFTEDSVFDQTKTILNHLAFMFSQYADFASAQKNKKVYVEDPKYSCQNYMHFNIGGFPCPDKETVKKYGNEMLKYLSLVWEKSEPSTMSQLAEGVSPQLGVPIPLNSKKQRRYRLTLKESLESTYELTNRAYDINNIAVPYVDEKGRTYRDKITTLERMEGVVREVRFGDNYLGAAYLNHVVSGQNYNEAVRGRKKMFNICSRVPLMKCGRKMSDNDKRMTKNALAFFDGLLDLNNGRGLDKRLHFGDYTQAFQATIVGSSAYKAQEAGLFPPSKELLQRHNGRLLSNISMMHGFTHLGRWIKDRFGRTDEEFRSYLNSKSLARLDRTLMAGHQFPNSGLVAERLVTKLREVPNGQNQNLLSLGIDWLASLNYEETRIAEETLGNAMLVGSYLGSPELVFNLKKEQVENNPELKKLSEKYSKNNFYQMYLTTEKLFDLWPILKNAFPEDAKAIDAVTSANSMLSFLKQNLELTEDPLKNRFYIALNDLFLVLDPVLFKEYKFNSTTSVAGIDLLISTLKHPELVSQFFAITRGTAHYLSLLHANGAIWFKTVAQNTNRLVESVSLDMSPIKEYLKFTTKKEVCLMQTSTCSPNFHYDEPVKLLSYLGQKDVSGKSRARVAAETVLVKNRDELSDMLDSLLPSIVIRPRQKVQVPYNATSL